MTFQVVCFAWIFFRSDSFADAWDLIQRLFTAWGQPSPLVTWGVLAAITQEALKSYGYDVKVCWVCWSTFGPREMGDKTKPELPPGAENENEDGSPGADLDSAGGHPGTAE